MDHVIHDVDRAVWSTSSYDRTRLRPTGMRSTSDRQFIIQQYAGFTLPEPITRSRRYDG
ncbi:uncharacterized protein EI90DRAFT_3038269 [Cantharellus anzutake]|uniref:uncharacterized protein n=1 Tax=Cantharellus anzutake TaxID=1750568 RepID=UPI0019087899|nr:uncharacterized protein EI90DRAFT_3038269 [Cantharellus anzutake]KAF8339904.1 hypothetical protein EI90DRAFT_3038269 [Cantharellus anzutake]